MVNPKGNPDNLKPFKKGDTTGKAENGRKGGRASQKKQAQLRGLEECYKTFLKMTVGQLHVNGITLDKELEAICTDDMTIEQVIAMKQTTMAIFGSHQAYEHIRDQLGQKPVDKQELTVSEKDPKDMNRKELESFLSKSTVDE